MSFAAALAAIGSAGAAVGGALGSAGAAVGGALGMGGGAAAGSGAAMGGLAGAEAGIGSAASAAITPAFGSAAAGASGAAPIASSFAAGADALGTAGAFQGMGGAASPGLLQQGMDMYGKVKSISNNHPNSGMDSQPAAQQQNQNPLFQQMMGQQAQQPQRQQQQVQMMPWDSLHNNIVQRRDNNAQNEMQLNQLMSMLGQGQLPLHSLEDTGGSGAGGSTGGLVKNVLSLIGGK